MPLPMRAFPWEEQLRHLTCGSVDVYLALLLLRTATVASEEIVASSASTSTLPSSSVGKRPMLCLSNYAISASSAVLSSSMWMCAAQTVLAGCGEAKRALTYVYETACYARYSGWPTACSMAYSIAIVRLRS